MVTLPNKHNLQHTVLYAASISKINDQVVQIDRNTQTSAAEVKQQISTYHDQAMAISNENTRAVKAGFIKLEKTTSAIPDQIRGVAESLQRFMADQFADTSDSTQLMQDLLQELRRSERPTKQDELSRKLKDSVDRLNAVSEMRESTESS